jgi:hypothetical protein
MSRSVQYTCDDDEDVVKKIAIRTRAHNRCRDNTLRQRTPARSTRCPPLSIALVRIAAAAAVVAVTRRRVVEQVHDVELEDVRVTPLPRTARTATSIIEWGQR